MATTKLTEKQIASLVKDDAKLIVTQKAGATDTDDTMYRASLEDVSTALMKSAHKSEQMMLRTIVDKASGDVVTLDTAANSPVVSFRAIGKSTQSATPTMENPIAINGIGTKVVGGVNDGKYAVNIHSRGKNLFNKAESSISAIQSETAGEFWGTNIFPTGYDLRRVFPEGQKVTVSYDVECVSVPSGGTDPGDGRRFGFSILVGGSWIDLTTWTYLSAGQKLHVSKGFTVPQNFAGATMRWYSNRYLVNGSGQRCQMIFRNIQVELGETETAYEPYAEDSDATLYLTDELHGIDDLHDEIVVNADGTGKLIRRFGKKIFDGTEPWVSTSINGHPFFYCVMSTAPMGAADYPYLCSHFAAGKYAECVNESKHSCFGSSAFQIRTGHENATAVKTWVQGLYNNGTPLTLVHQLRTPTETDLTAEEVQEVLALRTFKPNAVVTADGAEIEVEYVCDPKNYIDKKVNEIATALVANGGN